MPADNKTLTQQSIDLINKGDVAGFLQQLDPKFQDVFGDAAKQATAAFPDLKITVDDVVSDGDKVVMRWTMTGTHRGEAADSVLGKVPPTNRPILVTGITINRIQNGKVVESWGENSRLEGIEQLGLTDSYAKAVAARNFPSLVQTALEQVFNQGHVEAAEQFFAPDLAALVRSGVTENRAAFPDLKYTITHLEVIGDEVTFAYTASGTNRGKLQNMDPTGRAIQWEGSATALIVDGKVTNLHVVEDQRAKLLKLGLTTLLGHTMTGNWSTNVLGIQISLSLTQTGQTVSGTGRTNLGPQTFPVHGSSSDPNVNLQSQLDPHNLLVFNGTFKDANTVGGTYVLGTTSGSATLTRS